MNPQTIQILDCSGKALAIASVSPSGPSFEGTIDLKQTSEPLLSLSVEFEDIVNNQMFSFLDEIQSRINALRLSVRFEDGTRKTIHNLQVFPSTGDVSFMVDSATSRNDTDQPTLTRSSRDN